MKKAMVYYDYLDIDVKKHFKWFYTEYYPCFGWELLEIMSSEKSKSNLHLTFKRKHDFREKDRICHYQHKFEHCMEELRDLEISKKFSAIVSGVAVGLAGILFVTAGIILMKQGAAYGMALLIPGFASFLLAYPCYRVISRNKEKQVEPLIQERHDELFLLSQKAAQILEQV